jgi:phosphomannomutase/phosphoglucomutase
MGSSIFREYDIRGVAERDFDAAFARRLGRAYAGYVEANAPAPVRGRRRRIGVGRDCRLTSDDYAAALRTGLRESGCDVVDLGVCPTPLVYFSLFHLDLDGGLQVTGSHNPADQNGFKICVGKASIHGEQIQQLRRVMESERYPSGRGEEESVDIVERYQSHLIAHFSPVTRPLRIAVDAGNATAGPVAPRIFRAMGCEVDELYCEMDGRFPNHHPDPTVEENLRDLVDRVRAFDAEIGIGFDGDADRLGVVDKNGRVVWGDELMILFAREVLAASPGATIVSEVKCSQRLYDEIEALGGVPIMWKAGHSPIKAKMRETGAALGGEMSGHIFFADRYFGYDDGIYAACRVLEILSQRGKRIDELLGDLPQTFTTPEIRLDCGDEIKFAVVERAIQYFRDRYDIIDIDGVRVTLPHGWGLIRASNTQPAVVLRFEADSQSSLDQYRHQFEDVLRAIRAEIE